MTVVLARTKEGMERSVQDFERAGLSVVQAPVTAIAPPEQWEDADRTLNTLSSYVALACTSANGISGLHQRISDAHPALISELARIPIYVVGSSSAERARKLGLKPVLLPDVADGVTLGAAMARVLLVGSRVLHVRGDLADASLRRSLLAAECIVDEAVVYRTRIADAETLRSIAEACRHANPDAVVYFSPSSVDGLELALGTFWLRQHRAIPLGERTADALRSRAISVEFIPDRPSGEQIAHALASSLTSL
jgi:uroporphyrinogen III methyltransferase/synthase